MIDANKLIEELEDLDYILSNSETADCKKISKKDRIAAGIRKIDWLISEVKSSEILKLLKIEADRKDRLEIAFLNKQQRERKAIERVIEREKVGFISKPCSDCIKGQKGINKHGRKCGLCDGTGHVKVIVRGES